MTILEQLSNNKALWVSVLSWAIAQLMKTILVLLKTKKFDPVLLLSSGGMPSSHSSSVTALSTAIGLQMGFDSPLFAISAVISMVVMYDAAGVRRAAGKQAAVLNIFMENMEHFIENLEVDERLKELLGHTPIEVAAGAVLGIVVAVLAF